MRITFKPQHGFYKEFFLNLLLIFLTMGIYLPWGVTYIRRLVWSNISLDDQRFYYLGKASEIVKGYLVLILLYMLTRLFTLITEQFSEDSFMSMIYTIPAALVFFTVLYKAQLGSFKYQAKRTAYKGIRFNTTLPGAKDQYLQCLRMGIITVLSFGIMYGYYYFKIEKEKYNSLFYGDEKFSFDLTFRQYALVYFNHFMMFAFTVILFYFLSFHMQMRGVVFTTTTIVLYYCVFITGFFAIFTHLLFTVFHLKIRHLKTQSLKFNSDLDYRSFFRVNLLNLFMLVFTLGLAFPLVIARNIALYADSLKVEGMEALNIHTYSQFNSSFDDILSQSFDLDVLDVF